MSRAQWHWHGGGAWRREAFPNDGDIELPPRDYDPVRTGRAPSTGQYTAAVAHMGDRRPDSETLGMTPTEPTAAPNNRSVIIIDPAERRWILLNPGLGDRVAARAIAVKLDAELAAGAPAYGNKLRAIRAGMLVHPDRRNELANYWLQLLASQRCSWPTWDPRVPRACLQIQTAETAIVELAQALRAQQPAPVRGVALAEVLLTDGGGPVFNVDARRSLVEMVHDALWHLDPVRDLDHLEPY
jgi:hypothetical protein